MPFLVYRPKMNKDPYVVFENDSYQTFALPQFQATYASNASTSFPTASTTSRPDFELLDDLKTFGWRVVEISESDPVFATHKANHEHLTYGSHVVRRQTLRQAWELETKNRDRKERRRASLASIGEKVDKVKVNIKKVVSPGKLKRGDGEKDEDGKGLLGGEEEEEEEGEEGEEMEKDGEDGEDFKDKL